MSSQFGRKSRRYLFRRFLALGGRCFLLFYFVVHFHVQASEWCAAKTNGLVDCCTRWKCHQQLSEATLGDLSESVICDQLPLYQHVM